MTTRLPGRRCRLVGRRGIRRVEKGEPAHAGAVARRAAFGNRQTHRHRTCGLGTGGHSKHRPHTGWSFLDMAGSVSEWTRLPAANPANPLGSKNWVIIGGSYLKPGSNALSREWTVRPLAAPRRPRLSRGFRGRMKATPIELIDISEKLINMRPMTRDGQRPDGSAGFSSCLLWTGVVSGAWFYRKMHHRPRRHPHHPQPPTSYDLEIIHYHDPKNPQSVELAFNLNEIGIKYAMQVLVTRVDIRANPLETKNRGVKSAPHVSMSDRRHRGLRVPRPLAQGQDRAQGGGNPPRPQKNTWARDWRPVDEGHAAMPGPRPAKPHVTMKSFPICSSSVFAGHCPAKKSGR